MKRWVRAPTLTGWQPYGVDYRARLRYLDSLHTIKAETPKRAIGRRRVVGQGINCKIEINCWLVGVGWLVDVGADSVTDGRPGG